MNNQNTTTSILILGVAILCVFSYVVAVNMLPNNVSSESYFSKINLEVSAKIDSLKMEDGKLMITLSEDNASICAKTTKSTPKDNSICWIQAKENIVKISVYQNENYYIWIKDKNGNISSPQSYYTK